MRLPYGFTEIIEAGLVGAHYLRLDVVCAAQRRQIRPLETIVRDWRVRIVVSVSRIRMKGDIPGASGKAFVVSELPDAVIHIDGVRRGPVHIVEEISAEAGWPKRYTIAAGV